VDKPAIRAQLLAKRRERAARETATQRSQRASLIAQQCLALSDVARICDAGNLVTSYEALTSEPPTDTLNEALVAAGARVAVPVHVVDGEALDDMRWIDLTSRQVLAMNTEALLALGVAVVFTPALAIGRDGSRLGKGKGYYDKFFSQLPQFPRGPLRVGIVEPTSVFDTLPTEEHDEVLDTYVAG
jgi:5-formyltetrahydrofolate cyclo-ligase